MPNWHSWFGWSWHLGKEECWGQVEDVAGSTGEDWKTWGRGVSFVYASIPVDLRLPLPILLPQNLHLTLSVPAPGPER